MLDFSSIQDEMKKEKGREVKELVMEMDKLFTDKKLLALKEFEEKLKALRGLYSKEVGFTEVIEAVDTILRFLSKEAPLVLASARGAVPRKKRDKEAEKKRREEKALKEGKELRAISA